MANNSTVKVVAHCDLKLDDVKFAFGEIGPVKQCVLKKNGKSESKGSRSVAYVTFALEEDAEEAVKQGSKIKVAGNNVKVSVTSFDKTLGRLPRSHKSGFAIDGAEAIETPEFRINKKARLVVRNLPFSASEAEFRKHFAKHGNVLEAHLLLMPDGRKKGVGFIQFKNMVDAAKAIKETNAKPFKGRPIAVDWALPRSEFEKQRQASATDVLVNTEIETDVVNGGEQDLPDDVADSVIEEVGQEETSSEESSQEECDEADKRESASSEEDGGDEEEGSQRPTPQSVVRSESRDVREKKTIFVRNISFETDEDMLKETFEELFGDVKYALLVKDRITQRARGTAFVQFVDSESAQKALSHDGPILLDGRDVHILEAVGRDKLCLQQKQDDGKKERNRDKRNLYLAREGGIRQGTQAAEGLSQHDLQLRSRLMKFKKEALKNLNNFISPVRLCIHNLPFSLDDKGLRKIFKMHSPASATIKEARVMREKTAVNEAKPKSKGYGFVTFAVHEDALDALRKVNNNPHIFTAQRRPVVEFSVENKAALEAKEKRAVRSREKNPTFIAKHKINTVREAPPVKQNSKKRSRNALDEEDQTEEPQTKRAFMGLAAEQGNKKVPAHLNPKIRHRNMRDQKAVVALQKGKKISRNMLKRQKKAKNKETSLARRSRASKRVFNATGEAQKTAYESESSGRIEKQRKKAGPGKKKISARDKAFDGLVAKYKAQFKGIAEDRVQKRKWFSVS